MKRIFPFSHLCFFDMRIDRYAIPVLIIIFGTISIGLEGQVIFQEESINGVSFRGPRYERDLNPDSFGEILEVNANWVAFTPEVILDRSTLKLRSDKDNHWWGNTISGNIILIRMAKEAGLKVMLKPQMILDNVTFPSGLFSDLIKLEDQGGKIVSDKSDGASWRGDFDPLTKESWMIWEQSYRSYILSLARTAEELEVDLFCIGTELKISTKKRPEFWRQLISDVRKVYSGPISYSANWDEYSRIEFWDELDIIGVNSYCPISLRRTPTVEGTIDNWKYYKKVLKEFSEGLDKDVLITEFGYRNVSFAGLRPWIHDDGDSKSNLEAQSNLYEAFFRSYWNEPWIKGGFSWNWDAVTKGIGNTDFSIQNKPAQEILSNWYKK